MYASINRALATIEFLATPDPDSRWPQGYDDWLARFDTTQPYPFYSPLEPSTAGAPLPNGGYRASMPPLPPSSERVPTSSFSQPNGNFHAVARQQRDFSAEVQPLAYRHPFKTDKARTPERGDEVATYLSRPSIANPRKRATREEVPEQHEASVSMEDAREEAKLRMGRARIAAKRVSKTLSRIQKLSNSLVIDKANKTRAVDKAAALEHAAGKALDALNLARAESSTIQKKLEDCSRPRRLFNYIMAKWEAEPRLEVAEAACRVDEATRVHSSARAEADKAWDTTYRCAQEVGMTSTSLRKAQKSHANAKRVHVAIQTAADRAADQVVRMADAGEVGRFLAESFCEACGRGARMHQPLLALSRNAASYKDGFTSDQVVPSTKRVRH